MSTLTIVGAAAFAVGFLGLLINVARKSENKSSLFAFIGILGLAVTAFAGYNQKIQVKTGLVDGGSDRVPAPHANPHTERTENNNDDTPPPTPSPLAIGTDIRDARVLTDIAFNVENPEQNASYIWEFGDGKKAEGANVSHQFQETGVFDVELTRMIGTQKSTAKKIVRVCKPAQNVLLYDTTLDDVFAADASQNDVTGAVRKAFDCSTLIFETPQVVIASESAAPCKCTVKFSLSGPDCNQIAQYTVQAAEQNSENIKLSCNGATGEYTWKAERLFEGSDACFCSWSGIAPKISEE